MKHKTQFRLFAAAIILLASTAQSCEWNSERFDTFVREDGSILRCPSPEDIESSSNSTSQPKLLFIEKLNSTDEEQQTNENDDNNIIRCAETCDDNNLFDKCVPLTDSRCADFADGLKNGICPKNKDCLLYEGANYYCGQEVLECTEDTDCAEKVDEQEGWESATCQNNRCYASKCTNNHHINNIKDDDGNLLSYGYCEYNSIDNCGKHGNKCGYTASEKDNDYDYTVYSCENEQCIIFSCLSGYHKGDNGKCLRDDIYSCAGLNCTLLSGWEDGICNSETKCQSTKCSKGWHTYNKIVDGNFIACVADTDQDCGAIGTACQSKEGEIRGCVQGDCVLRGCLDGYHKSTNNNETTCKLDSITECGSEAFDCTKLSGVNPNTAKCVNPTVCYDDTCLLGYHSTGEAGLNPCEADTNENCGSHGNKCPAESPVCTYTESSAAKCATVCDDELTLCDNGCYDTNTSIIHCGNSPKCGVDCTVTYPNANVACQQGQCILNSCKTGYHMENNICTLDTIDNCGGSDCNSSVPANATVSSCNLGTCLYECDDGFTMCEGICIKLDEKHFTSCGVCETGYANCDASNYNGCETNLEDYGLADCNVCSSEYTACGSTSTSTGYTVPLCLKQGHYYKNYEGDSENLVSCHNTSYKYHKVYSQNSSSESSTCYNNDNKYINYEYIDDGYLKTEFYNTHFYKLENDGWNSSIFTWSSEHCKSACTGNWNFSPDTDTPHKDASGNIIEAWSHQCQPKQECDQFDSFELTSDTTNHNKFYFDYSCKY